MVSLIWSTYNPNLMESIRQINSHAYCKNKETFISFICIYQAYAKINSQKPQVAKQIYFYTANK